MKVWYLVLGLLVILLIVSSIDVSPKDGDSLSVKDNKMTAYVTGREDGVMKIFRGPVEIKSDNARFFEYEEQEEELERCIEKITKNWRRVDSKISNVKKYDENGELISEVSWSREGDSVFGFDEEEDYAFRSELRERPKKGEKIC